MKFYRFTTDIHTVHIYTSDKCMSIITQNNGDPTLLNITERSIAEQYYKHVKGKDTRISFYKDMNRIFGRKNSLYADAQCITVPEFNKSVTKDTKPELIYEIHFVDGTMYTEKSHKVTDVFVGIYYVDVVRGDLLCSFIRVIESLQKVGISNQDIANVLVPAKEIMIERSVNCRIHIYLRREE